MFLSTLSPAVKDSILRDLVVTVEEIVCPAGDYVFLEGERGYDMLVLSRGMLNVYKQTVFLSVLRPGDYFGDNGFLSLIPPRKRECRRLLESLRVSCFAHCRN